MFFISPALYPLWRLEESGAWWLLKVAQWNPFTHVVEALRFAMHGQFNVLSWAVVVAGSACFFALAWWGYDPQRGWIKQRGAA
ncbi:MAG: ABC transporter permease, partial [Polaromonas sp.]